MIRDDRQDGREGAVDRALEQLARRRYPAHRSLRRTRELVRQRLGRTEPRGPHLRAWQVVLVGALTVGAAGVAGNELGLLDGWRLTAEVEGRALSLSGDDVKQVQRGDSVEFTVGPLEGDAVEGKTVHVTVERAPSPSSSPAPAPAPARLRIDPFLVSWANVAWEMIASPDNPVWPGWDASDTPLLIYLPGVQDVLLNHPHPPADFVPYEGGVSFAFGDIVLRDGPTLIEWDGQNTSRDVFGVRTLVVADTLSSRKNWLRGVLNDPRPPEVKLGEMDYERNLLTDPYHQLGTIVHEAFHVFQDRAAPDKGANELEVRLYPCLSVENNVGFALEGMALAELLRAEDDEVARAAALRWLAVRLDRRAALPPGAVAYEDGNEFAEGLALYTEWVLPSVLPELTPPDELRWSQGFRGFEDLTWTRDELIERLRAGMRGEINVNNDPYGTSPLRARLYTSGMAVAALLDRFGPADWKRRILEDGTTLTGLAREALAPTPDALDEALRAARSDPGYDELVAAKEELAREGRRDTLEMLEAIGAGPGTALTFDYSALTEDVSSLSFTAFGVRSVDPERCIYTLVPIRMSLGDGRYRFAERVPTPTLDDRGGRLFRLALGETLTSAALGELLGQPATRSERGDEWHVRDLDTLVGGVQVMAARARLVLSADGLLLECLPTD